MYGEEGFCFASLLLLPRLCSGQKDSQMDRDSALQGRWVYPNRYKIRLLSLLGYSFTAAMKCQMENHDAPSTLVLIK